MSESTSTIERVIEFINNNDGINAWLIMLVSVVIIPIVAFALKRLFFTKKQDVTLQKQEGGDKSEMYQAGGKMHVDKSIKHD